MKNKMFSLLHAALIIMMCVAFSSCKKTSAEDAGLLEYAKVNDFPILKEKVKNADPAILFCYSNYLFDKGAKDEAVFWYYLAQFRYRLLVSSSLKLKAGSIDEALAKDFLLKSGVYSSEEQLTHLHLIGGAYRIELYETIQAVLGAKINGYAYGDIKKANATIHRVLTYEAENPFDMEGLYAPPILKSKDEQAKMLQKVIESYKEQIAYTSKNADSIKAERAKNGLK